VNVVGIVGMKRRLDLHGDVVARFAGLWVVLAKR
jgi:hypothetical protein